MSSKVDEKKEETKELTSVAAGDGEEGNKSVTEDSTSTEKKEDTTPPVASTPSDNGVSSSSNNEQKDKESEEKPLSKSQMKKRKRWERAIEAKKKRKQHEKDLKAAKAKAEGRDLDQERRMLEQRTQDGAGKRKRLEEWENTKAPLVKKSWQVVLDCSFETQMTKKEVSSLSSQIRYCYASNRRNNHPCQLTISSLAGKTLANLHNVSGFDEWTQRAFSHSDKSLEEIFAADNRLNDIVYLTSDSETVIEELDNSKIYVIGGIVDRNRLPRMAIDRAEKLGLATARLPLEHHLKKMQGTKVLTCNHVFEILLKYREHGNDWEKALLEVLPSRKDIAVKNENQPPPPKSDQDMHTNKETKKDDAKDDPTKK
ncbi:tRNA methyltransferase 10 homolog A [Seminavis robusta]|uniref:tRNA (guanine(9)-N(1))-methyltransferase n=1 Tax=Seminavis robusta TaxID=568900 RepID=A0A9N8ER39_9STRA|nr:tRNA methyltransferase 10 homolog A [Seminavis robusta]|eukprot:Sro1601_g285140.1 tRNA methyltransferase 10 homolog A (370) ;mRNA; f:7110-8219